MYQATAAEFMPLPTMEIRLAVNTNRKGLWLKLARILLTLADTGQIHHGGTLDTEEEFTKRRQRPEKPECVATPARSHLFAQVRGAHEGVRPKRERGWGLACGPVRR